MSVPPLNISMNRNFARPLGTGFRAPPSGQERYETGKEAVIVPRRGKKRVPRPIAAAFTVAAPQGARIRDRLRLTPADAQVLMLIGEHLGCHQRADLAERVRAGDVAAGGDRGPGGRRR